MQWIEALIKTLIAFADLLATPSIGQVASRPTLQVNHQTLCRRFGSVRVRLTATAGRGQRRLSGASVSPGTRLDPEGSSFDTLGGVPRPRQRVGGNRPGL